MKNTFNNLVTSKIIYSNMSAIPGSPNIILKRSSSSTPVQADENQEIGEDFVLFFPKEMAFEIFNRIDPSAMRTNVNYVSRDWRFLADDYLYWARELESIFAAFSDNLRVKNAQCRYAQGGEKNPKEILKFLFEDLYETVDQISDVLKTKNPAKYLNAGIFPPVEGSSFQQFTILENTLFELTDELIGPDLPAGHQSQIYDYPLYMSDIEKFLTERFVVEWFPRLAAIEKTFLFDSLTISEIAIQRNDYATLDWLTENDRYCFSFLGDRPSANSLYYSLFEKNNLAMLKYLFSKDKLVNFDDEQNLSARQHCVELAILHGHFELLEWTKEIGLYHFGNKTLPEANKWAIALLKTESMGILYWCKENEILPPVLNRDYFSVLELMKSSNGHEAIDSWIKDHPILRLYNQDRKLLNSELQAVFLEKKAQRLFQAYQLDY